MDVTEAGFDPAEPGYARQGPWLQALARFRRRPLGVAAFVLVAALVLIGALAGQIAPYYPGQEFVQFIGHAARPLTPHHLLGTDVLGRDFFTQVVFAIRETALSALICAGGATFIGVVVGAVAGFFGGWFDELVSWSTRVVVAVPAIALLIVIAVWHKLPLSPTDDALFLMAVMWTGVARVTRAAVGSLKSNEYIEAAEASGSSGLRVLFRHILPNATGTVIVAGTNVIGQSIAIIATVDYLGYGYNKPESPTLGGLVADGTSSTIQQAGQASSIASVWWLYLIPAGLLVLSLLAVAFLGDALDESLNPTSA